MWVICTSPSQVPRNSHLQVGASVFTVKEYCRETPQFPDRSPEGSVLGGIRKFREVGWKSEHTALDHGRRPPHQMVTARQALLAPFFPRYPLLHLPTREVQRFNLAKRNPRSLRLWDVGHSRRQRWGLDQIPECSVNMCMLTCATPRPSLWLDLRIIKAGGA